MNRSFIIAGIGEILWDVLPEAEVLGGAPLNFAYHVNELGAAGIPISTVGADERGEKVFTLLQNKGLNTAGISKSPEFPTGFVQVLLDQQGSASYHFPEEVAWDHLEINEFASSLQSQLDAVCFGTLALRAKKTRDTLLSYLDGLSRRTLRVYDINLRQSFYSIEIIDTLLKHADIVKLNDEELIILKALYEQNLSDSTFLHFLIETYDLLLAVLTKGAAGSFLVTVDETSALKGSDTTVTDTIGAGDAFTAAVTLGYLHQRSLAAIHQKANELATYVCTQRGAMPAVPKRFAWH